MREPVAEVYASYGANIPGHSMYGNHGTEIQCLPDVPYLPPGTKLYAFPPDAAGEIKRLKKYAENRDFAYNAIDRYLRNNMGDEDYALFSAHLDALYAIPSDVAMEIERLKRDYNDLLYQVEQKHPDETRHETARRLIRAAQRQPAKAALAREEDK